MSETRGRIGCSFLELYNEETMDLLAVGDRQDQKLRIMEDRSGVVIQVLHSNTLSSERLLTWGQSLIRERSSGFPKKFNLLLAALRQPTTSA
jgi:hypothetical protein